MIVGGKTFLRGAIQALAIAMATQTVSAAVATDPTTAGSFTARSGEYKFAARFDPLVTNALQTEIWGRVWYPANKTTKSPLVVLLHGNHSTCGHTVGNFRIDDRADYTFTGQCPAGYVVTPNHTGYDYAAQRLATRGYIVVSINVNRGINVAPDVAGENDPGNILRRGRMILRHLQTLYGWHANGGQPASIGYNLRGKIDFNKVTLFGHSRGGDAIIAAYNIYRSSPDWRSRVPNVRFLGLASMAPTDFQNGAPRVLGTRFSVLLPMCDGDVNRLSGIHFYDRSVNGDTPDEAGFFKSALGVWGTNHNGYNTQWQSDDSYPNNHSCPAQNRIFQVPVGLSPQQQAIGRYFLMGLARGATESPSLAQLFNPAFTLPPNLRSQTRIDRSFFAGRGSTSRRLVRFDGVCSQKIAVTAGVATSGVCSTIPEHTLSTPIAVIRWGSPSASQGFSNFAQFTVLSGGGFNLNQFATLDMRVAPDCQRANVGTASAVCVDQSAQGTGGGVRNVGIVLQDTANQLSRTLNLADYWERRDAVGISAPNLPVNPMGHALMSSVRIPMSAFARGGFNMGSVKYILITLGGPNDRGGLFFGDIYGVNVPTNGIQDERDADEPVASAGNVVLAAADAPANLRNVALIPVKDGPAADDQVQPAADRAATVAAADPGSSLVSVTRSSLQVGTGEPAPDSNPERAATRTVPAVEFTIATQKQIVEGDAGMSVRIGGRLVQARRFGTGRETQTPSVIRLVVPAEAVDSAADGAPLAVVSGGSVVNLGPLAKSAIR